MLDSASSTASHLSSKVKQLDLEKKRVEETFGVVEQVSELKACVQGVVGSMGAPQDWEAAAGYIARASKVPKHIIEGKFAARIVPSVEVPDAPGVTIESAKESLCGLFLREFEKAAEEGDNAKITRFFKLFPLIGREETGLEVYGRYVCQGVAQKARGNLKEGTKGRDGKEGFFYANAITKLFEHIAQIVENHGTLVERHYGQGRMVKVIERLQIEADVQGGIILDTWGDERSVDRKMKDVKSYPFSFLVQSFLPAQRGPGISRTSSPAVGSGTNGRLSEDEGVDMKEVDGLLNEMAMMLGRWSLYSRFLAGKCRVSPPKGVLLQAISKISQDPAIDPDEPLVMPELLIKSALSRKISARLITPFEEMTTFFFRRSVEKAFQLDESPTGLSLNLSKPLDGNPPFIISPVDDVMYIVNTVLQRSLSTSQRDVIASVIPTIGRVLGSDFVGMIQRKMRDESYPKAVIQGGFPPEDKIISFIVLINSLDIANDYIARIVTSRISPTDPSAASLADLYPFAQDATFVTHALKSLNTSFSSKTGELITDGLTVMFERVVKPRLRPVLRDTFRDVDYSLTEDELADLARQNDEDEDPDVQHDIVARRFEHAWDAIMKSIQRIMTPKSLTLLLDSTAKDLAKTLEKRVWSYAGKMNVQGASRMERDFSGIIGVVARGGRYGVRDLFARVVQVCMLVNMGEEEWEAINEVEEEGEEEMAWVLTKEERKRARALVR
jgi:conserved oligomeric Golgi complex subunit 4